MICILHPYVDGPAGFKDYDETPVSHTAHVTCKDMPMYDEAWNSDELACFYCGEQQVMILDTCAKCDKRMCHACLDVTGGCCSCHLTNERTVVLDSFTPDPHEDKSHNVQEEAEKSCVGRGRSGEKTRQRNVVRPNKFGDQ